MATKKILNLELLEINYFSRHIAKYLTMPMPQKLILFVLPIAFVYLLHALPLLYALKLLLTKTPTTYITNLWPIAIALVILGRLVSHLYLLQIQKSKKTSFNHFVVDGIFKYSRNPGLLGLYISFSGFLILQPHTIFIICYLIYLIHMHFKIIMEEDYLSNKYGKKYAIYKQNTKRYL
ncbi:MAG: hypothetical protein HRT67_05440 [Flavobacteriaceae bacterium]|nr:hypothetical protein [Flavobacteriaceae bacterium]